MKGVAPFVSHATYLLIGLVALSTLLVAVYESTGNIEEKYLQIQGEYFAESVKSDILDLMQLAEHSNYLPDKDEVLGSMELNLPEKIHENIYYISIDNNYITVSIRGPKTVINSTTKINTDVELNGFSEIPAHLDLIRSSDGKNRIELVS